MISDHTLSIYLKYENINIQSIDAVMLISQIALLSFRHNFCENYVIRLLKIPIGEKGMNLKNLSKTKSIQ